MIFLEDQKLSFYRQGNFIDLCRGPHFQSTKYLGHSFKLLKLAGAYWRGDSNKEKCYREFMELLSSVIKI